MSIDDSLLLYLHFPKTAGVSVKSRLQSYYDPSTVLHVSGPDYAASENSIFQLDAESKSRVRIVLGHFSFGLHNAFDRPSRYYSILRDPVDRLLSLYYFTRTTASHPRYLPANEMSLSEFVLSGIHPEIENCQTKMLSGRFDSNWNHGPEKCTEGDLQRAIHHLDESFIRIGIYEHLNLSMFDLCLQMGWTYSPVERKNITRARRHISDLSPSEVEVLRSVNQCDLRLYQEAMSRFRDQIRKLTIADRIRFQITNLRMRARRRIS